MIQFRRSLAKFGLGGLLAGLCLWIDTNPAFLHNSHLLLTLVIDGLSVQANSMWVPCYFLVSVCLALFSWRILIQQWVLSIQTRDRRNGKLLILSGLYGKLSGK
jgi:hypothetical protein